MVSLKQSYHFCPINWKVNHPCNEPIEGGRKSKTLAHNNSRTLTSWEARENLLLRLLTSAAKRPCSWLIWLSALDQMFDVIGYNWSDVWCDWKYIHEVISWETVQQCDRGISSSKTLLLEFRFALFLSSTSTSTTLTTNGFPLNRYGRLELTFCWT